MKLFKTAVIVILMAFTLKVAAIPITVKGIGKGPDLVTAQKEAVLKARIAMMKECEKIVLTWAEVCYPDTDYDFAKVSKIVGQRFFSAYITKEKVKGNKRKGYTVTITIQMGTNSHDTAEHLLEAFRNNIDQLDLKTIGYNPKKALKDMIYVVERW